MYARGTGDYCCGCGCDDDCSCSGGCGCGCDRGDGCIGGEDMQYCLQLDSELLSLARHQRRFGVLELYSVLSLYPLVGHSRFVSVSLHTQGMCKCECSKGGPCRYKSSGGFAWPWYWVCRSLQGVVCAQL